MSMNHLTDSGMWSNLFLLADTAVMVQEEEQRRRRGEEDSEKSFFYLFPRKKRSSLVKRRYTPQNPNGTSRMSPSSSLDDHETKNTQNPSFFDDPVVYDAKLLRAKKGKSKIVYEDYEYRRESDEATRLFEKNMKRLVRNLRRNLDDLDGSSSSSMSSSFLNLRCYNNPSLLLGYNSAKSEKTETNNPSYQPCLKENTTSRKRRAVQQRKSGNFKKAKVASFPRRTDSDAPEWIFQVMRRMRADAANPLLIIEKGLKASDVKSGQSRLLIPFQQLIRNNFLTPGESRAIDKDEYKENDDENIGVGAIFVNQRCQKWGVRFKKWAMEKDSGHGTLNYALNWGWNDVVKGNDLKEDDKISLWAFRWRGVLCFALETY
ncbi:PREDICTED: putative B3 domain-containing protein At5g35780 [Camelina sativa]|uniref:B3 domain-containing protein At5g35780 n=1 Tax=Camelina sativa TaxID=90675 RepID=A0ABM0WTG3_CAMSA|nr:PREDICTED: putative B3 domain-containing protein At5g35780 [Camelina sativa]